MTPRKLVGLDFRGNDHIVARSFRAPTYRLELRFRLIFPMQQASTVRRAALSMCPARTQRCRT
jgi:hypothetical protein